MKYFNVMFLLVLFTGFNCLDVFPASRAFRVLPALTNPALTRKIPGSSTSTNFLRSFSSEHKREQSWRLSDCFNKMLFGTGAKAPVPVITESSNSSDDNFAPLSRADIYLLRACDAEGVTSALSDGAYVNVKDDEYRTPLHHAVQRASLESLPIIRILLAAKARVNEQDYLGHTPLHYYFFILYHNKTLSREIVRLLLKAGACVNVQDKDGNTLLYHAAASSRDEVMPLLLKAGADVNKKNKDGKTPLYGALKAIFYEKYALTKVYYNRRVYRNLQLLLKAGAHLFVQDKDGNTPLHAAVFAEDATAVKLLLDAGAFAFVDIQDRDGDTPLHEAARRGHSAIIELLLKYGANKKLVNAYRQTPRDMIHTGWISGPECIALLQD